MDEPEAQPAGATRLPRSAAERPPRSPQAQRPRERGAAWSQPPGPSSRGRLFSLPSPAVSTATRPPGTAAKQSRHQWSPRGAAQMAPRGRQHPDSRKPRLLASGLREARGRSGRGRQARPPGVRSHSALSSVITAHSCRCVAAHGALQPRRRRRAGRRRQVAVEVRPRRKAVPPTQHSVPTLRTRGRQTRVDKGTATEGIFRGSFEVQPEHNPCPHLGLPFARLGPWAPARPARREPQGDRHPETCSTKRGSRWNSSLTGSRWGSQVKIPTIRSSSVYPVQLSKRRGTCHGRCLSTTGCEAPPGLGAALS